ncbi:hypothetical protein L914_07643 [Phytophthora nicotianae]|uniref:Uncharacterized protein n=1 Tax=Phytophthora nicotianae TaxID=4792 RepID=W2NGB9_PHYNI|nr:hypothetical protein L914_07643 [Phytophthora nicotianae]
MSIMVIGDARDLKRLALTSFQQLRFLERDIFQLIHIVDQDLNFAIGSCCNFTLAYRVGLGLYCPGHTALSHDQRQTIKVASEQSVSVGLAADKISPTNSAIAKTLGREA